jgi:hypothetical protein
VALMADKDTGKAKPATKPAGRTIAVAAAADPMTALQTERDALKAELAAAKVRIDALEAANAQVADRIAWMIDSLQSLKDGVKS